MLVPTSADSLKQGGEVQLPSLHRRTITIADQLNRDEENDNESEMSKRKRFSILSPDSKHPLVMNLSYE